MAKLEWKNNQTPISRYFDDVYFSVENGLEESRYVFLDHNDLTRRFSQSSYFCIGELGFGTGLNFCAAWERWSRVAPAGARLQYISCEKYPLTREQLEKASQSWKELLPQYQELIKSYPSRCLDSVSGRQVIELDHGRVQLVLLIGDALTELRNFSGRVDAWFLDGFSPNKNPQMWSAPLFSELARHSDHKTTFSTFATARLVKESLQQSGFHYRKSPGFGKKREMLCGEYRGESAPSFSFLEEKKPWFSRSNVKSSSKKEAVIIGAGLAGSSLAYELALRGWQIKLIERHRRVGMEASGNPAGAIFPAIAANDHRIARFSYTAFWPFLQQLKQFPRLRWGQTGLLQLAHNETTLQRFRNAQSFWKWPREFCRWVDWEEASQLSGIPVAVPGLYFPQAGWVDPLSLCQSYLEAFPSQVQVQLETEAISIQQENGQWHVIDLSGKVIAQTETLIIANASDLEQFDQTRNLGVRRQRGQLMQLLETQATEKLQTVLSFERYFTPSIGGLHVLGASHSREDTFQGVRLEENIQLVKQLSRWIPGLQVDEIEDLPSRVSFRATTPDSLPLVGPVPHRKHYENFYSDLYQGKHPSRYPQAEYHPGLFVNVGHGGRGILYTSLASKSLAAELNGESQPLEEDLWTSLHPARFLVKEFRSHPEAVTGSSTGLSRGGPISVDPQGSAHRGR